MKAFFKKHRRLCLNVITVFAVVLLVGMNILFPYLMQSGANYIDITPEGLYTLSDPMVEVCKDLKGDITITFCDDPDRLLAYHDIRYAYIMAQQLSEVNPNIRVETVNLSLNPTAVDKFKQTSSVEIQASDMIVSCGSRYRLLSAAPLWTADKTTGELFSFNGEYKMATALLSVTALVQPVVCFAYGHGERIYVPENYTPTAEQPQDLRDEKWGHDDNRSAFYSLMEMVGLKVQYINLDKEDIPDECALLVMDGPTSDYDLGDPNSIEEDNNALRRIHDYLSRKDNAAWMLFKDPSVGTLTNLEDLAKDWGIGFDSGSHIKDDPAHSLPDAPSTLRPNQTLIATLAPDEDATPYAIFGDLLKTGAPPRMIVKDSGSVYGSWMNDLVGGSGINNTEAYYFDFMYSSEKSDKINIETGDYEAFDTAYPLAGISMRVLSSTAEKDTHWFSYLFAAASTSLTTNDYLADASYSNYDVMFSTVRLISRANSYASMELGGTSWNSSNYGGKQLVSVVIPEDGYVSEGYVTDEAGNTYYKEIKRYSTLREDDSVKWISVLTIIPLVAAVTAGTIILVKRRNR